MNGLAGKAGWRWIFIMEGTITCAMGVASYFLVVDFPEKALDSWKFLKEDELKIIIDRVDRDSRDVTLPPFHLGSYLRNALDWKVYFYAANFGLTSLVSYAVAYFLPIVLLDGLHFSTAAAQCLSAPVSSRLLI
jgi:sugar phosphate permease